MTTTRPQPSTAVNAALKALESASDGLDALRVASALGRHWLADWPVGFESPPPPTYEDRVFTRMEKAGGHHALALAAALGVLAPAVNARCSNSVSDLQARIGPGDSRITCGGVAAEFVGAWTSDPGCQQDGRAIVVAVEHGGIPATVFVFIDHTIGRLATRVSVDRGHRVRPADPRMPELSPADARAHIEGALTRTSRWHPERHPFPGSPADRAARASETRRRSVYAYSDPWNEPTPPADRRDAISLPYPPADLLLARHLLTGLPTTGIDRGPTMLESADRARLVREFLEARGLLATDDAAVRAIVDFSGDEVDGDPWRWSPEVVRRFLLDGAACRAVLRGTCSADRLEATLPAWLRHAAPRGMSTATLDESLAAMEQARPQFRTMLTEAYRRLSSEDFYPRYEEDCAW